VWLVRLHGLSRLLELLSLLSACAVDSRSSNLLMPCAITVPAKLPVRYSMSDGFGLEAVHPLLIRACPTCNMSRIILLASVRSRTC